MKTRERTEDALLRELAAWGGTFKPGLERRDVLTTGDGLAVEITIRVRRHAGAEELRDRRAWALAILRNHPYRARHCGVNIEKRSAWGGSKRITTCDGRIVAAVVFDAIGRSDGECTFVCSRHREKHGLDFSRVLTTIELTPSELREAHQLEEAHRFAWERKCLADEHERGAHASGHYLQGLSPTASEDEIRRYWNGGRGRIAPCPRCQAEAAARG